MTSFISGAVMMGCFVIAAIFWKSWRRTADRLLGWFALSFLLLGVERLMIEATHVQELSTPWVYVMRLVAFGVIAVAIVEKNRS
jgi:hypothetical protein